MAFDWFIRNGEILGVADATIPLTNIEYAYGFGVYETIRVVHGKPLFATMHTERLMRSALEIGLEHPFASPAIASWIDLLLKKITGDSLNIKILLIGAREKKDALLFMLPLAPLFPDKKIFTRGASAFTVRYERFLPHAKTLNMLGSFLAFRAAKQRGGFDALLVNRSDCIVEGTRTNFFCIKDRTIISPPLADILEGVTLLHLFAVAKRHGFSVQHQPIPLSSLGSFDGAFLTSATAKIVPLTLIDDHVLTIPPALAELVEHFDAFLDEEVKRTEK